MAFRGKCFIQCYICVYSLSLLTTTSVWDPLPTLTLPRADYGSAAGSYNNTVFIIGGYNYTQQCTQYTIETNTIIDTGEQFSSSHIYGNGQFYAQIHETLYISSGSNLAVFNMKTKQIINNWKNITIKTSNDDGGTCLAASNDYLFITGGNDIVQSKLIYYKDLQILDLYSNEWILDAPLMNKARATHSCAVNDGHLFVFTGKFMDSIGATNVFWPSSSFEYISITDITHKSWIESEDGVMFEVLRYSHAVSFMHYIYIIGGVHTAIIFPIAPSDIVQIFDTESLSMVTSYNLSYKAGHAAIARNEDVIFVFGGIDSGAAMNTGQAFIIAATLATSTQFSSTMETAATSESERTTTQKQIETINTDTTIATKSGIFTSSLTTNLSISSTNSSNTNTTQIVPTDSSKTDITQIVFTTALSISSAYSSNTNITSGIFTTEMETETQINSKWKQSLLLIVIASISILLLIMIVIMMVIILKSYKNTVNTDVGNVASEINSAQNEVIMKTQFENEEEPSLVEMERTVEGQDNVVNNNVKSTKTNGLNDDEYQYNPNIADDEFIIEDETITTGGM